MSILNVVKLSHGFGDRAIFTDVLPPSEGGARRLCWGKWRREIHIYEYYHRKADA